MQKNDRKRIISQSECNLMQLLSHDQYTFETMNNLDNTKQIHNFKEIGELQNFDERVNDHSNGFSKEIEGN